MKLEDILTKIKYQGPDAHADMTRALRLNPVAFEKFIKEPSGGYIEPETIEALGHWFRGSYVKLSTAEGYHFKPRKRPSVVAAPHLSPLFEAPEVDYGDPARGQVRAAAGCVVVDQRKTEEARHAMGLGGSANFNVPENERRTQPLPMKPSAEKPKKPPRVLPLWPDRAAPD